MKRLLALGLLLTATCTFAGKLLVTDFNSALKKAQSENKMLFLIMGRDECPNCNALRGMIAKRSVQLSDSKFVTADVNIDNSANKSAFSAQFHLVGNVLPFVIIAAPDGRQLAAHSGPGTDKDFNKLIQTASKAAKQGASPGS